MNIPKNKPPRVLLARNVRAFARFVRNEFDPTCARSFAKADALYRLALTNAGVRK
jgi:hypothetical protein